MIIFINIFLVITAILYMLNAVADLSLGHVKTFILDMVLGVWSFVIFFNNFDYRYYVGVTEFIYLLAFFSHIYHKKHLAIIISGIITISSNYILTHIK